MSDAFFSAPPLYSEYTKKLCRFKKQFPFLKMSAVGRSVAGRKLYALCFGKMNSPVIFAGAFHAQEWLTESLLLRFSQELCSQIQAGGEICRALENRGAVILPCVNPDGVELALTFGESAGRYRRFTDSISGGDYSSWQANIRGVDLNHNFNAGHKILRKMENEAGITGPSPSKYGGVAAHSEPEVKAVAALCTRVCAGRVYAFHSQGEEIFYRYGENTPACSLRMAKMLSQASGYKLSEQVSLASHGGFKDWFIEKYGKPGFTIEIGRGKNPLPISELSPIFARLYEMMLLALVI